MTDTINVNGEDISVDKYLSDIYKKTSDSMRSGSQYGSSSDPSFVGVPGLFKQYQLTEIQLKHITNMCTHENGSNEGIAWGASQMCNLFERNGGAYTKDGNGLYNYVTKSGWYSTAKQSVFNCTPSNKALEIVKNVIIGGKRVIPNFVVEHDCTSDIKTISTGGDPKNRHQYVSGKTIIKNRYGSTYTFYGFPDGADGRMDPFGYFKVNENSPTPYKLSDVGAQ